MIPRIDSLLRFRREITSLFDTSLLVDYKDKRPHPLQMMSYCSRFGVGISILILSGELIPIVSLMFLSACFFVFYIFSFLYF